MASCGMQPANPTESAELARVAQSVAERSSRILGDVVRKQGEMLSGVMRDELGIAKAFMDLYARLAANPGLIASEAVSLWLDYLRLWQAAWMKLFGVDVPPVAEPAKGDWRFKDDEWSRNFVFDYLKQSYLLAARYVDDLVEAARLDPKAPVHNGLGVVYIRLGQTSEAIAQFKEALRLRPDDADAAENLRFAVARGTQGGSTPR